MVFDLDQWLAEEDSQEATDKLFPHDIFISHRRAETPDELMNALTARNVNYVWDANLDLRDRRVVQGLGRAMRRSRFVALYVSDTYTDSLWCRAEYLNALKVEREYAVQRAIVICESDRAFPRVPDVLLQVPRFVSDETGLGELAAFVLAGNICGSDEMMEQRLRQVPAARLSHDTALLSFDEQLNLLEQRLLFWIERGAEEIINMSHKARQAAVLAALMSEPITEPESIFRAVSKIVFAPGRLNERREGVGAVEFERVISMVNSLVGCYGNHQRMEEVRASEEWTYDFVLKPLLLAVELRSTRSNAATAYRNTCSALSSGEVRHLVPVYLQVLEAVESGREIVRSAISNHKAALYFAHERQTAHRTEG